MGSPRSNHSGGAAGGLPIARIGGPAYNHRTMDGGVFILIIVILIAGLGFSIYHSRLVGEAWEQAGRRLELTYTAGGIGQSRELRGRIDDHVVVAFSGTLSKVDGFMRRMFIQCSE